MMKGLVAAFAIGAATVFGYAPFEVFPLPLVSLALLFELWRRADTPRRTATLGFVWGLGCFLAGVSWVYVSLHDVGGMAMPIAIVATLAFCAVLAIFPALAGYVWGRWRTGRPGADALLAAGAWALTEWLRGWVLTGFPWLAIGYSQTPPSPLAGYAPILGVYGVGLLAAGIASMLLFHWRRPLSWASVGLVLAVGIGLRGMDWTQPVGEPLQVSLLQGNIPQSLKWIPENLTKSIETYARLASEHPAALTVLPETAIPLLFDQIPREVLRGLTANGTVLLGAPIRTRERGYANGAVAVTPELEVQAYAKAHLVPFGEFVPPGFAWFFGLVNIPMSDFSAGPANQRPIEVAGQRLMPNICYEDLFGEEIRRALPEATLLINLSNTAWFGDSLAQPQHLQIARMRALETGRPILRATNTGMTAAVTPDGHVAAVLRPFVADALTVSVRGYVGMTPFATMGNTLVVLLACLACAPALRAGQRTGRRSVETALT